MYKVEARSSTLREKRKVSIGFSVVHAHIECGHCCAGKLTELGLTTAHFAVPGAIHKLATIALPEAIAQHVLVTRANIVQGQPCTVTEKQ